MARIARGAHCARLRFGRATFAARVLHGLRARQAPGGAHSAERERGNAHTMRILRESGGWCFACASRRLRVRQCRKAHCARLRFGRATFATRVLHGLRARQAPGGTHGDMCSAGRECEKLRTAQMIVLV